MLTTIIIPYFNRWDLTHARLYDIFSHVKTDESRPIEVVLINDCSTDADCEGGAAWWQKSVKKSYEIRYHKNSQNYGFGRSCNIGARMAQGDFLVFLSNDVVIRGDFLVPVLERLASKPKSVIGGRVLAFDTGWNTILVDGHKQIIPYPEGWLIACTKEAWVDLGGFDPRYAPYDCEDVDLGATAIQKGYELVSLDSPHLQHLSGQTIMTVNRNRQAVTNINRQKFIEKWTPILNAKVSA